MNTVAIVLGIIIVILLYVLYDYFMNKASTLQVNSVHLKTVPPPIPGSSITSPTSTRYAYGLWVYVNSWNVGQHTLLERPGNFKIYLDVNTPTLKCDITMTDGATDSIRTLQITDNFPLQKWTQIIISVDNQYVDAYLDGKLLSSQRMYTSSPSVTMPKPPPDTINSGATNVGAIFIGNSNIPGNASYVPFDTLIANIKRWDKSPVNPEDAWSSYMRGNGQSSTTLGSWGADLTIFKNNIQNSNYRLF